MEKWLTEKYGEDSELYRDLLRLINLGVAEGWAANQKIDGPNYRRSRILEPSPETFRFSITAVYMNSKNPQRCKEEYDNEILRGQYHGHPSGEINLVVPLDEDAQLKGLQGWQGLVGRRPIPDAGTIQRSGAVRSLHCSIFRQAASPMILHLQPDCDGHK
ncbi:DUF4863 family protein [Microvirga vignae]|uniref:4-hydroxylaminobenzoate lyase n=1 Tax=Microvirga vignae TaxID=1225564 RepID=UPI000B065860